jgi:ubiquinone/menaquinone biosynthesis C-methylase UbiE
LRSREEQRANVEAWSESAPYWERHAAVIRAMFEPLSDALIEDAALEPGKSALDVAAGTGEPALRIAEICGPSTRVACTDVVAEMVAAAKREAARRELRNVTFTQCAADALPFRSHQFDAAVCRLGVRFFHDAIASIGDMLRVLRPDGRVAFAVWHESKCNPFFNATLDVVAHHVQLSSMPPDARGAFRYAAPGKLAGLLARAGATAVSERVLDFRIEAPVGIADFWPLRVDMSEALRGLMPGLPIGTMRRIREEVERAIRPWFPGDRMSFPARAIIVSAGKPD